MIIARSLARPALAAALALLMVAPAAAKDRSAPAVMQDPAGWVTADDYPAAALKTGQEGVSTVHWDVTETGTVENCRVVASSGSPDLDQAACTAIVSRARYTPALDRKGRPTRAAGERRVRWQMPVAQPDTVVPYTLKPF